LTSVCAGKAVEIVTLPRPSSYTAPEIHCAGKPCLTRQALKIVIAGEMFNAIVLSAVELIAVIVSRASAIVSSAGEGTGTSKPVWAVELLWILLISGAIKFSPRTLVT